MSEAGVNILDAWSPLPIEDAVGQPVDLNLLSVSTVICLQVSASHPSLILSIFFPPELSCSNIYNNG